MVGGFRIERLVGSGSVGTVFEATQVSLGRSVALRVIGADHFPAPEDLERFDAQQRLLASLHHPRLVPTYAVGEWDGGRYVATRHVRGTTLATLLEHGVAPAEKALEPLGDAVQAAHAAGLVHGNIEARNVLVDPGGACYLADFALGRPGSQEQDLLALAAVLHAARTVTASGSRRRKTRALTLLAVGAGAAISVGALLTFDGSADEAATVAAPPPAPGTEAVGSSLESDAPAMLACSETPSANTPGCTLLQRRLAGGEEVVPRGGVIRGWAVRGGSGTVALQVVRESTKEKSFVAGFTQPVTLSGSGVQEFEADVEVKAGDRIGIHLEPGAAVGSRETGDGSLVVRWDGVLTGEARPNTGTIAETELLLRADIDFGASAPGPEQLVGQAATRAAAGTVLTGAPLRLPVAEGVGVVVIEVDGAVAIDVFARGERLSRTAVPSADAEGQLLELAASCGPIVPGGFCLRWSNPGQTLPLEHQYVARADGRLTFIG